MYSSTRADYGILQNLIQKIDASPELCLQIIASGTHLVHDQGMTINEIESDGFAVDEKIDIALGDDSAQGICHSMGVAVSEYAKSLTQLKPDILVILGDRFESFCCAAAATVCRVPIAHIHGGETTQGAMDEAFRHSITKMAHIHFPCCDIYRQRIIQLGEAPDRVFDVGALGVENIKTIRLMIKHELEASLDFKLDGPFFLITFHPVTLENETAGEQFGQLLAALDRFQDHKCIFTQANADTDGRIINQMMVAYAEKHSDRSMTIASLGYLRYLSAVSLSAAVLGNSSSGIIEVPCLGVPTVNIGDRQKGRVRVDSVIDCGTETKDIVSALNKAIDADFRQSLKNINNPYYRPDTAKTIAEIIKGTTLEGILKKQFYDLDLSNTLIKESAL